MAHEPDDDADDDDFQDPDAWLDSDFPAAAEEDTARITKLRELRDQGKVLQPTLIRHPNDDPIFRRVETVIPGSVEDYEVTEQGGQWMVIAIPTGEKIYDGPGPVEIVRSPAPF
jgi:hypothetical protein